MCKRAYSFAFALGAGLLVNLSSHADTSDETAQVDQGQAPMGQSAGRVYLHPKTGELTGPPPGVEPPGLSIAMQQKLSRSSKGLQKHDMPNGAIVLHLQGRFQNVSAVSFGADGEAKFSCNHSVTGVEQALVPESDEVWQGEARP